MIVDFDIQPGFIWAIFYLIFFDTCLYITGIASIVQWYPPERTFGTGGECCPDMFTTYVLQDDEGNLYKGVTSDLDRRLLEHIKKVIQKLLDE